MNEHANKILQWQDALTIKKLRSSLEQDHVSITSTDTILGFLATTTLQSFNNINKLKESRPSTSPYIVLISASINLGSFIDANSLSPKLLEFIQACWPGSVTFIFKASPALLPHMISTTQTIALRCPNHEGVQKILAYFSMGLFSTSANKSGKTPPQTISDIDPDIEALVDFIVLDQPAKPPTTPSTIIDTTIAYDCIKFIRNGNARLEEIARKLNIRVTL